MTNSEIKSLIILFHIDGRDLEIKRYLKLLEIYKSNLNILIIRDKNLSSPNNYANNFVYYINSKNCIIGMNDIFRSILEARDYIKDFKYVCFAEDDNFIFPKSICECQNFLEKNIDYIACNGKSFLFYKKNNEYSFLNKYISPNFNSNNLSNRLKEYNSTSGLVYYSLIRSKIMLDICENISLIKDDNLSEVLFDYLLPIKGKLKKLNLIYLAREWPRPKVYNIPDKITWVRNKNLFNDLIKSFEILFSEFKKVELNIKKLELFDLTLSKYLHLRFAEKKQSKFFEIFANKIIFYIYNNNYIVKKFLSNLNKIDLYQ